MIEALVLLAALSFGWQATQPAIGVYQIAPLDATHVLRMDTRTGTGQVCSVQGGRAVCDEPKVAK